MSETIYTMVRYTGVRNLNVGHFELLLEKFLEKRFIHVVNAVGRMAGNLIKPGDLKVNPNGAVREWLWGVIIEDERPLTDRQWRRVSNVAAREGISVTRNSHGTVGGALRVLIAKIMDDYGVVPASVGSVKERFQEDYANVVEHEIQLAAVDVLNDFSLPVGEAVDFVVPNGFNLIMSLQANPIHLIWEGYVTGAGSAKWETV